jgi:hypothetical protein
MATGENFMRATWQRQDAMRPRLIVDKKTEQKINAEIRQLQNERTLVYENLDITDEECDQKGRELDQKINGLINSMYETKEQAMARFYKK